MGKIIFATILLMGFHSAHSIAAVDMKACIERLEIETAENIGTVREEEGHPVPPLTCKIEILRRKDGMPNTPCEQSIKYKATCMPGPIVDLGGACCPG